MIRPCAWAGAALSERAAELNWSSNTPGRAFGSKGSHRPERVSSRRALRTGGLRRCCSIFMGLMLRLWGRGGPRRGDRRVRPRREMPASGLIEAEARNQVVDDLLQRVE